MSIVRDRGVDRIGGFLLTLMCFGGFLTVIVPWWCPGMFIEGFSFDLINSQWQAVRLLSKRQKGAIAKKCKQG